MTDGTYEYTYDSDNRLTYARELDSGNYTNYIYNSVGVLVAAIKFKGGRVVESISRDYDAVKLIEFNGHEITYDEIGNPLTYYNGAKFTWQMGRQLASAQMSDGTQISYKYNADGIRTEKKINDTTTTYTLIGSKITGQTDGTNTFYFRYDENDNLIGFELGNKQYFYITNLVGDIIAIVDSDGAAVVKYEYDPWGVCTIVSDTSNCNLGKLNPFRYRGYYYDEETSLYYLQSRYYDPATMRFINADDPNMLLADCYNPNVLYRWDYCENNPVMFVDYTGDISISTTNIYTNFKYDKKRKFYYAPLNAWQRNFGYTDLYDRVAGLVCDLKTTKIYFNYKNKTWRVQLWKGKYAWASSKGYATGAEIGLYYKNKNSNSSNYSCVSNADTLSMSYTLYDGNKKLLSTSSSYHDNYKKRHWWLTSFIINRNCKSKNLRMNIQIQLKDQNMFEAFKNAVKKNKNLAYFGCRKSDKIVQFSWK